MDWKDVERMRAPGFSMARRGYDRHEVDRFLNRLAEWLETDAPSEIGQMAVARKLELVGKSTAHILLTTEQEAEEMLRRAKQESADLRKAAETAATDKRRAADEHATTARAKADEDARRTTDAATAKATKLVEDAERRCAQIDAVVAELTARRDDTLRDLERLQGEIGATLGKHGGAARATKRKAAGPGDGNGEAATADGGDAPAARQPRAARESAAAG